ncbi:hypothetical protein J1N35_007636, partial [Gossypium stocksii]
MATLQNLQDEDVEWRAPWMIPNKILYRVNDNILVPSQENTRLIEKHLQVIPFELEIIKQVFEKMSS